MRTTWPKLDLEREKEIYLVQIIKKSRAQNNRQRLESVFWEWNSSHGCLQSIAGLNSYRCGTSSFKRTEKIIHLVGRNPKSKQCVLWDWNSSPGFRVSSEHCWVEFMVLFLLCFKITENTFWFWFEKCIHILMILVFSTIVSSSSPFAGGENLQE